MIFTEVEPSYQFRPYIEKYLYCSTEDQFYPFWFKAIPNGFTELFFNIKGSKFIIQSKRYKMENPKAFFVGIHDIYADSFIKNNSPMRSFIVIFKITGYKSFFNFNEASLINQIFDAETLTNGAINKTWIELNQAQHPEEMKAVFEENFGHYLNNSYKIEPEITNFINKIIDFKGFKSITEICEICKVQERKLERIFKNYTGLSPSKYSQIICINNLFSLSVNFSRLIELAIESGYYDQAHFNRDFKKITLLTPKEFFEKVGNLFYDKSTTNRVYIPLDEKTVNSVLQN